jgi:hypothetical protein
VRSIRIFDDETMRLIAVKTEPEVLELLGYYVGWSELEEWIEEGDA